MEATHVVYLLFLCSYAFASERLGHMEKLGMQRPSEGHVEILQEVPDPVSFHEQFILTSKPCVFKDAAKAMPAFQNWSDEYLKEKYGDLKVFIEAGKKENRSMGSFEYTMEEFLNKYKEEDVYVVHSIQKPMRGDVTLLPCLACGGFTDVVQDIVLWFSSGGTKSVLHNDMIDNINCLFSGEKELYMVDAKYAGTIPMDHESGSYSMVDVDAVDTDKYAIFGDLPWFEAKLKAGDCLFIPKGWYHQVRSPGGRNIAVNVWFTNMPAINKTDCEVNEKPGYTPLENLKLGSQDGVRTILKLMVGEDGLKPLQFTQAIRNYTWGINRKGLKRLFLHADVDGDKLVTQEDIANMGEEAMYDFNRLTHFGVMNGDGEEEGEEGDYNGQPEGENEMPAGSKEEL